ncbi:lytic murein transglycosylase [Ramlibacter ginsenosidimutans]|uniref:Lytic murein transglycosylase n=1 Tax=Ramlibacter ginsenosidimutans TaxID=502333 RepID=A0A934U1G3_9BURK|nr:lytic murein transglycosylase [Ramlibacter ginsenosidimutans]MBK6009217.1 lytic murein transglycosylase [Ramlibacter ginsenosidimutans]
MGDALFARSGPALVLALLAACSQSTPAVELDQPLQPEQFQSCVQNLADQTALSGRPLKREDFEQIAANAHYDDRVRQGLLVQAGEPTYWWDELAATTDAQRVADGQAIIARAGPTLQRIEQEFGVPKEIIVAIYGIETNYGPSQGKVPVLDAAVTMACLRPCPESATAPGSCASRERAFAAVRVLRDKRVPADSWLGSWAAAFGRTQFVPDSFEQLAVDFDGDGYADIIHSEPDAWATTANHLKQRGGWNMAWPVYIEVTIPPEQQAEFNTGGESKRLQDRAKPLSQWMADGWRALDRNGIPVPLQLPGDPEVYPFFPVGLPGPAFLVTRNFDTILRYNRSVRYVMEVALLANKIAGGPGFITPWPTDDPGLSRAQVKELQQWLQQQGHDKVVPDGVMGRNTRDAIEAALIAKGLPPQRRAGQKTMALLMQP